MFKHAYNMCHVKDAVMGTDGQAHTVDLPRMFAIARAGGYQGYFSMEWEIRLGDPFAGTQRLVEETLK